MRSFGSPLWNWANWGISPAPLKIGKGTVRYSRPQYLTWIAGGCKPLNGEQAE